MHYLTTFRLTGLLTVGIGHYLSTIENGRAAALGAGTGACACAGGPENSGKLLGVIPPRVPKFPAGVRRSQVHQS